MNLEGNRRKILELEELTGKIFNPKNLDAAFFF